MKKNQIMNWVSLTLACVGVLFREMHWPFSSIIILLSLLSLIVSAILSFQANKLNGLGKTINYLITVILIILIFGFINSYLALLPFFVEIRQVGIVILPIILLVANKENKISNSYWTSLMIFIMLSYLLMSFNISRLANELGDCERNQEQVQSQNNQQ